MKYRPATLLSLVAILVAVNVWNWWPRDQLNRKQQNNHPTRWNFQIEDFRIKTPFSSAEESRVHRNLFHPKIARKKAPVVEKVMMVPEGPPPKTPQQLAEEASKAELAQIKCVGVAFRNNKWQAFLVKGDQLFLAFAGDRVGKRFIVDQVTLESVYLKDPATNVSGKIKVSGK